MVLNDKILARKYEAIAQIMDQDGGVTLIEALGVLRYVEHAFFENFQRGKLKALKPQDDYNKVKARRLSEMS